MSPALYFCRVHISFFLDRGDPDVSDENGFSALHVAAKYGNTAAAEVMLNKEKEANLWGLDNLGRTPARVAALSNRAECCRFLDALAIRWQMQNQDYTVKMQNKAMKELSKRVEKEAKAQREERRDPKKKEGERRGSGNGDDMKSSSTTQISSGRKKKGSTPAEVLRQNFELRPTVSADQINETTTTTSSDDEEGGVLRPAGVKTGPLLNNLKSLAKGHPPGSLGREQGRGGGGISQESGLGSEMFLPASTSPSVHSGDSQTAGLPDVVLSSQPIVIENDSPLATFLQSLNLIDHIQLLHREKLDLEALALCEEKDLSDIGLPLGPRKKILKAVQKRQTLLKKPGRMTDTEL